MDPAPALSYSKYLCRIFVITFIAEHEKPFKL